MSFQILLHWAGPKQAMKDSLVSQVPFTSQTYAFHNTRYGFCSAPEPCCPARSSSASLDSLEVPTKQQRRRRMPLEPCCPGIRGLPLGATVLRQLPGTTLREQPTSLPGRAALLSQHPPPPHPPPPRPPTTPVPFTAKAGKDPSGHEWMGHSQQWEQCPSVVAGSVPLSASPLSCRHLKPEKARSKTLLPFK